VRSANMDKHTNRGFTEQHINASGDKPDRKCYALDAVLSVNEYREILNDNASTGEQIKQRVQFLEAFCRKIIRLELEKYGK
jgi:hypothetical protein